MRRLALIAVLGLLLVGCGGGETVSPAPETVDTTGQTTTAETETTQPGTGGGAIEGDPAAGKAVFESNGCGSCHTFKPAGSSGTTGPDLDELPDFAEKANQPLEEFVPESITNPNAYVEEGFPEGVMPAYDKLSEEELNNLVAFLTQT